MSIDTTAVREATEFAKTCTREEIVEWITHMDAEIGTPAHGDTRQEIRRILVKLNV